MGTELIAAIVGPALGGVISLILWQNKKNYEFINNGFSRIGTTTNVIERKLDDLRYDVAKNYVTNEDLVSHIQGEEVWHRNMDEQMSSVRKELSDVRNIIEKDNG